jgi:chlorobactene glucosyltransferase
MTSVTLPLALMWFGVVMALIACLVWQYFTYPIVRRCGVGDLKEMPLVSVIVPARDEEANIERCVRCLLDQSYPTSHYEIIVVDDGSTDRTASLVTALAGESGRVVLLNAGAVPEGWGGKTHACQVGATRATGQVLFFLDADTFADKSMLASCWDKMEERGCDLLSFTPHEEMLGIWERTVMPWGFLLLALEFDFRKVNTPSCPDAVANGQCMIFRRVCYESIGGHGCVKGEILEDICMAKAVKSAGFGLFFARGEELASTRMYQRFSDLRDGLVRITQRVLGGSRRTLVHIGVSFVLALCPLGVPVLVLYVGGCDQVIVGILAVISSLSFFALSGWMCHYFRIPLVWALFSPIGFALWGALVFDGLVRRRGIRWKGRVISSRVSG